MDDKQYPQQEALNEVKKIYMNIFSIPEGRNDFELLDKSFLMKQATHHHVYYYQNELDHNFQLDFQKIGLNHPVLILKCR